MKNVLRSVRAVVLASSMLVSFVSVIALGSSNAGADTPVPAFYLAIGGSASLGIQPTISYPKGQRTDDGYADYFVADEASKGVAFALHEIGCSGETTETMLHGGDRCYTTPDTQLNEAIAFLKSHDDEDGVVTIDLGFNDLLPCLHAPSPNPKCVERQMNVVRSQLTEIVGLLKDVAGPNVKFIGLGHYDPFLANELIASHHSNLAKWSLHVVRHLDQVLSTVYASYGIPIADVGDAFKIDSTTPVTIAGLGTVPENVAQVCLLTWMCQSPPLGPNIHPNAAGYQTIATAIEEQFTPW
jgi:lysophospholipase L1-like esterase